MIIWERIKNTKLIITHDDGRKDWLEIPLYKSNYSLTYDIMSTLVAYAQDVEDYDFKHVKCFLIEKGKKRGICCISSAGKSIREAKPDEKLPKYSR